MHDSLAIFFKKSASSSVVSVSNIPVNNVNVGSSEKLKLAWDPACSGGSIQLSDNNKHCFLKEQSYLFRTTITNQGFTEGVHYWEIEADART